MNRPPASKRLRLRPSEMPIDNRAKLSDHNWGFGKMTLGSTPRPSDTPPRHSLLLPRMWVEVLPATEIVSTLDADQTLDGLPFMPEMLPHCGERFRVSVRAERTCVHPPDRTLRKMAGAVVLEGIRCDGSLHGGCQLGCMIFWKEAWLKRVPSGKPASKPEAPATEPMAHLALRATSREDPERYFCQATALPEATESGDPFWRPGQYLRLLKVRTFTPSELIRMFARPARRRIARLVRSLTPRHAVAEAPMPETPRLEPGEWVEVKSKEEIHLTLDGRRLHKGLAFSGDMYAQCGRQMKVQTRVERIVEERTGRLRAVNDTVVLGGSICDRYFGCARGMPFLWREAWLKRVEQRPPSGDLRSGPLVSQGDS